MTDKVLSQDEVNALLKGVASGDIETEASKDKTSSGVRPYDFTSQERIIRGRMPGLEVANERFSRLFRNSISALIMRVINISIQGVEIVKFSDFVKTIPMPSSINIFKMEPLKGHALLVMEAPLVFAFIEFFFGGANAEQIKFEERPFTSIEQRVIQKVATIALDNMATAWNGIAPIQPEYVGLEINPQFVTIVTPTEIVIKIEIHIEIENFKGKLLFCIPYSMVEPVKEKLHSSIHSDKFETDQRWRAVLEEILMDSYAKLTAEIGRIEVTFEDLMNFEVGSVINLGKPVSDELVVRVEDVLKFKGLPCFSRGNQAIKLTKIL